MKPLNCPKCGRNTIRIAKKLFVSRRKPITCPDCNTKLYLHTGYEVVSRIAAFVILVPILLKLAADPSLLYGILFVQLFFVVWFVRRIFVPLRFY